MQEVTTEKKKIRTYPVDDAWRARVRARMLEKGITKADLHRAVGCSDATISHLIGEGKGPWSVGSRLVPRIHRILDWPAPPDSADVLDVDPRLAELHDLIDELTDEAREMLRAQLPLLPKRQDDEE